MRFRQKHSGKFKLFIVIAEYKEELTDSPHLSNTVRVESERNLHYKIEKHGSCGKDPLDTGCLQRKFTRHVCSRNGGLF